MKIVAAQHNAKLNLLQHKLNFHSLIMFNIRTSIKQFSEKEPFRHVVLNNMRNGPWTALIACAKFSLVFTLVYNQNYKEVF